MNKIGLIKRIDKVFGPVIVSAMNFLQPSRPIGVPLFKRLLILRPGGIGDAVLLIPAINELKKMFPTAAIDILAEKRNSKIFFLTGSINTILHYDRPKELFAAIRGPYDIVIDTEQWHRLSAAVAKLIGAPIVIGYATNERKKVFTYRISYSQDDYEMQSFFNLLSPISDGRMFDPGMPFLSIPTDLTKKAELFLKPLSKKTIVALFPGGSIKERKWGTGRFYEIAKVLRERGHSIVVVGGKEDINPGNEIIRGLQDCINLAGRLSLPETAAVLNGSSLLITNDSGIMHIGYGLGIKIVALFGPGREKKWAPRSENCIVINKNLSCSPCTMFGYTSKCKQNYECMKQITVEEVYTAAMALLEK